MSFVVLCGTLCLICANTTANAATDEDGLEVRPLIHYCPTSQARNNERTDDVNEKYWLVDERMR